MNAHPLLTRFAPLAVLAAAGLVAAGWTAYTTVQPRPIPPLATIPAQGPWAQRISASGLIETDGNQTPVGVPEAALITAVAVHAGSVVAAGDLLLRLDDRAVRDELAIATADIAAATADVAAAVARESRIAALPRAEEALPFSARITIVEAQLAVAKSNLVRAQELYAKKITSTQDLENRRGDVAVLQAQVVSAQADLARSRLPAWEPEVRQARAEIAQAQARLATAEARRAAALAHLGRLEIHAPCAGAVLTTTAMPGAMATPGDASLIVLGNLDRLLVRVEIDESQIWRWRSTAAGLGWLRGVPGQRFDLAFVRIEPAAAPRRAIPGKPGERLDGRAVQVLYQLSAPAAFLRPGLLLEVDLEAAELPTTTATTTADTPATKVIP